VKTEKEINFPVQAGIQCNVKHQSIIEERINLSRFRLWPEGTTEPDVWLCEENNCHIESSLPRIPVGSIGLFQYWGPPTERANIKIKQLDIDVSNLKVKKKGMKSFPNLGGKCDPLLLEFSGDWEYIER
jgi:hypothetical protein